MIQKGSVSSCLALVSGAGCADAEQGSLTCIESAFTDVSLLKVAQLMGVVKSLFQMCLGLNFVLLSTLQQP